MQIVLLALLAVCVPIAFCGYVYLSANDRVQLKQLHLAKETVGKVRATAAAAAVFVVRARALCVCVCGGGWVEAGCVRARGQNAFAKSGCAARDVMNLWEQDGASGVCEGKRSLGRMSWLNCCERSYQKLSVHVN